MDTMVEHVVEARIESIAETMARLEAAREQVAPKIEAALDRFVERVERDAAAGLNRPRWLLSGRCVESLVT